MSALRIQLSINREGINNLTVLPDVPVDRFDIWFRYPPVNRWQLVSPHEETSALQTIRQLQKLPVGTEIRVRAVNQDGESPWTSIEKVA